MISREKRQYFRACKTIKNFIDKYYEKYSKLQNKATNNFTFKGKPGLDNLVNNLLLTESENKDQDTLLALKYLYKEHELFKKYAPKILKRIIKINKNRHFCRIRYSEAEKWFNTYSKEFRKDSIKGQPAYYIWISENLEKIYRKEPEILNKIEDKIKNINKNKKEIKKFKKTIKKLKNEKIEEYCLTCDGFLNKDTYSVKGTNLFGNEYFFVRRRTKSFDKGHNLSTYWFNYITLDSLGEIIRKHL